MTYEKLKFDFKISIVYNCFIHGTFTAGAVRHREALR